MKVPDRSEGKKVVCRDCGRGFVARDEAPSAAPKKAIPARPRADDRLQKDAPSQRRAPARREEDDDRPRGPRRGEEEERPAKGGGVMLPLLIGGGALALLLLVGGGMGLWLMLRPGKSATQATGASGPDLVVVRPGAGGEPRPGPGGQQPAPGPGGAVVVPPVVLPPVVLPPAGGGGDEEFVDLPERNEGLGKIAGLGTDKEAPPGPPVGGPPDGTMGKVRVQLLSGSAGRVKGRVGVTVTVSYRFIEGGPGPVAGNCALILEPPVGLAFSFRILPGQLHQQGTVSVRPTGTRGPYRAYLAVERRVPGQGRRVEIISDVLIIN